MFEVHQCHHSLFSTAWVVLLIVCLCIQHVESSELNQLNDFIEHYEGLTYNTDYLHDKHERAKRSTDAKHRIQLDFTAHDRVFKLRLRRDTSVFSPNADLEHSGKIHMLDTSHLYSGEVKGIAKSSVHGSIIGGIFAGTIHTPEEIYHIDKSELYFSEPQAFHSVIYADKHVINAHLRKKRAIEHVESMECGTSDPNIAEWMEDVQNSAVHSTKFKRAAAESVEELWLNKYSLEAQQYYNAINHNTRTKRSTDTLKRTCTLYLEADPMLWKYMTGHGEKELKYEADRAMEEITSLFGTHVNGIRTIYNQIVFQHGSTPKYSGFNFVVRRVKINTEEDCEGTKAQTNLFCKPNIDVSNFLNLNSLNNHDLYCLAYVFTYRDFTGGTLGLAWVGSPTKASGGICEQYKEYNENGRRIYKSLNTGIVTLVNYGSRVPPKVSTLTFAHEVGHNFGSPHDGGSCVPTASNPNELLGNYIMFASATSGDRTNNNKFSDCSIRNMTNVLDAILNQINSKLNCFVESEEAFCGNAIREDTEDCDCGFLADCNKTDSCCYPQESDQRCTLKPHAECSPSQGPCCLSNCKKISRGGAPRQCKKATECSLSAFCNSTMAECPEPQPEPNLKPCNINTQVCKSGICSGTICEKISWTQCYMTDNTKDQKGDKGTLCYVACNNPTTNKCISTGDREALAEPENADLSSMLSELALTDIKLQPGAPCDNFKGYCDVFQKCRSVDADGPLARLKNLVFNPETLTTIKDWIVEMWWAVMLIGVGVVVFMGLFIKLCAVHTPSSNPKKAPARKIGLKQQPRPRNQGPPPGYAGGGPNRAGPAHGKGRGPGGSGRPPPYSSHGAGQMYEMRPGGGTPRA